MTADLPGWLIYALGVISGALLVLAIGPASDTFWDAVYWVRRVCIIVGASVLALAVIGGVGYIVWQSQAS